MSILPRGVKNRWLKYARHCWIKWKVHIYSYYIYTVNTCVAPNSSDETRNSILRYASSFDPQTSHANEGPVRTTSWLPAGFSIIGQHSSNIQMNVTQEIQPLNIGNKYIYIYILTSLTFQQKHAEKEHCAVRYSDNMRTFSHVIYVWAVAISLNLNLSIRYSSWFAASPSYEELHGQTARQWLQNSVLYKTKCHAGGPKSPKIWVLICMNEATQLAFLCPFGI